METNTNLLTFVQEALTKDTRLKTCLENIYILVNDGAVIIAGSVPDQALKNLAKKIISNVPGVDLLIDDLRVESPPANRVGVQIDWAKGSMALI